MNSAPHEMTFGHLMAEVISEYGAEDETARKAGAVLEEVSIELIDSGAAPASVLLEALGRMPQSLLAGEFEYIRRRNLDFELNQSRPLIDLSFTTDVSLEYTISANQVHEAVVQTNNTLLTLEQFTRVLRVPLSSLMGMRGMSVMVSAVLVSELAAVFGGSLFSNPHQDGHPDLLPRTAECLTYCAEIERSGRWSDKSAWTDVGFGGIEVKATNGNTPAARIHPKPALGEERSALVRSFDWKAHHRETRRLLGHTWDFVDSIPTVTASFWRNDLSEDDWGKIVSPRVGGGRTTSVSIMARPGLQKMASGWMARTTDPLLRTALRRGGMLV